ncbi:unnamed protein product [Hermetia illucens]|uniref:G-protein coupled receptors family 1 profile domain-containing protein n=2 Tax=Hermetia illucens TaxID=343691 RepID=A0A7R8V0S8_HERIL|nr:unnamed protein product [Hermetia illucens]
MRWLGDPLRGRLPAFVCCCATWLTGMVIALPYPIYTTYLDLGTYVAGLQGVGLCFVNLIDDMQEYMRGLFVIMYCAPTTILAYLYIRTSQELRPPDGPFAVMMFEHRADIRNRQRNSTTSSSTERPARQDSSRSYDLYNAELDVTREKRTQRHLGSMAATQVVCICPLMVLRLAKMVLTETYENARHFDFTYLMFVWTAFLPTVIFPCIYVCGILSRSEKERLRGYLRLSTRKKGSKKTRDPPEESTIHENLTPDVTTTNRSDSIEKQENHREPSEEKENVNIITNMRHPIVGRSTRPTPRFANYFQSATFTDSINNSCSNITSSTYCNNGTERGSVIDSENTSVLSADKDSLFERKWVNSLASSALCHKDVTFSDCESIVRHDSSSTFERDLEIIDLLERERSMDIQDIMQRERKGEFVRNPSSERRKLPDLGKICKSPKNSVYSYENAFDYPQRLPSRKSSHSSYVGHAVVKRDSLNSAGSECGVFPSRSDSVSKPVMENRVKRTKRNSSSSSRSLIKSQEHIFPNPEMDFRENVFANL